MLDELDPQQIALLIAEVQSEPWQHYNELGQWALTFSCTSRASNSEEKLKHHSAQGQLKKSSQASPGTPVFRSEIERKQSHGGRLLAEEKTQKKTETISWFSWKPALSKLYFFKVQLGKSTHWPLAD